MIIILLILNACTESLQNKREVTLGTFGAFYTKIDSGEEFEQFSRTGDYADVLVDLGSGNAKFVFWRGSSYLPYLETEEGKWYVEEVIPRSGDGEGMRPDRINTYTHVNIIESSPDKVIIHWRYLRSFQALIHMKGWKPQNSWMNISPLTETEM